MQKYIQQRIKRMNNYLNEEKIYKLINKIEKSVFYGDILSCKLEGSDVFALHEALMTLQQLVKLGIIGFNDEGFELKTKGFKK
jgi:hypothetical protein